MRVEIIGFILVICILVGVIFKDMKYHVISNNLVIVLGIIGLFMRVALGNTDFLQVILDSIPVAFIMLSTSLIFKGAFGGGDIKIMVSSGILLGYRKNMEVFVVAMILTLFVGGVQIIRGSKKGKDGIPLGPMISIGIIWGYVNVYLII